MKKFYSKSEYKKQLIKDIEDYKVKIQFHKNVDDDITAAKYEGMMIHAKQVIGLFLHNVEAKSKEYSLKEKTFHHCLSLYNKFAEYMLKDKLQLKAIDYIMLRKIVSYFRLISENEDKAKANFEMMLRKWHHLPIRWKEYIRPTAMNNNLFGIISHLKIKKINEDEYTKERKRQENEFKEAANKFNVED